MESWLYLPAVAAVLVTTAALILRGHVPRNWAWGVAALGLGAFAALCRIKYQIPYDFKLFRLCGKDVLAGLDYYALDPRGGRQLVLNPPSALPLFELFAALPLRKAAKVWTAANALALAWLVPLAYRALKSQGDGATETLSPSTLGVLAAAMALSQAGGSNLALGQLSIWTAAAIFGALRAQGSGRPIVAGICLATATVKVVTLLPFLLLFGRRRDVPTWITLGLVSLGLCLATGRAADLPARLARNLENIRALAEEGRVNDYSYAGPSHLSMIAPDHALYRLGLRDRGQIGMIQAAALAVLGLGVLATIADRRCPRGAALSLVSLYALLFFYHRVYDAVLLALPLVYCVGRVCVSPPGRSRPFALCVVLILVSLYMNQRFLALVETTSFGWGPWGGWVRAIVLPGSTWAILLAMLSLRAALPIPLVLRSGWPQRAPTSA